MELEDDNKLTYGYGDSLQEKGKGQQIFFKEKTESLVNTDLHLH